LTNSTATAGAGALVAAGLALGYVLVTGSLLHLPAAIAVELAAFVLLAAAIASSARPTRTALVGAVSAVAIDVAAATALRRGGIADHLPPSFAAWVGVLAASATVLTSAATRRALRVCATAGSGVITAAAGGALLINAHYAYYPTVRAALGSRSPDAVSVSHFAAELSVPPADRRAPRTDHGQVVALDPVATVSHLVHRRGEVWLPPAYFTRRRSTLPVIVMLAGTPGSPVAWDRAGFAVRTADQYARHHGGYAPILILTDQNGATTRDTECVDGPMGNGETFLTTDMTGFVGSRLGITPDPRRWAVVGFSEGGTCAVELGLRHPDVYSAFVDLAGDASPNLGGPSRTRRVLFGDDVEAQRAHTPMAMMRRERFEGTTGWFSAGRFDRGHQRVAMQLADAACRSGMHTYAWVDHGGHEWNFARRAFAHVLPELTRTLSDTPGRAAHRVPRVECVWA
jgi:enterochelin esterase-like enzyme